MNAIRFTYLAIGATLLLASCAKEEASELGIQTGDNRIYFRTFLPEITSRAQTISKENLNEFHVTVFNPADSDQNDSLHAFINDEVVIKDSDSELFSSENCKWPRKGKDNKELTFFAYYPKLNEEATLKNATTISGSNVNFDYKIKDFRVSEDISKQVDFITAYTTGSVKANLLSGINFNFKHQLSRIEINAKGTNKSCKIEIAGIRIGGIYTQGTYNFKAEEGAGDWTIDEQKKEKVEYVYCQNDKIVTIDNTETCVSIMGGPEGGNYAMLLPATYTSWDLANNNTDSSKGLYLSVLLRIIDNSGKQQYPYFDNSQGLNALNIRKVYLAIGGDGKVTANLYKGDGEKYYTDSLKTIEYNAPQGSEVKEFGWASVPISAEWQAGFTYTYNLDYTYGVGLHDPSETGDVSPKAGDPVFSDRVGITVDVKSWQSSTPSSITVPGS